MLTLKRIAVTGEIASGKSTVCHILKELGSYVISADEIVHQLLSPDTELGKNIVNLLGNEVVVDGSFHRKKISEKVFCNPDLLKKFEQLLHPKVQEVIDLSYHSLSQTKKRYSSFVAEIPLLFEAHLEKHYDTILLVMAHKSLCENRFTKKTALSPSEFLRRTQRLIPIEEKIKKSDFIIENNGSYEELEKHIKVIYKELIKEP